jgi:hypothetical protein
MTPESNVVHCPVCSCALAGEAAVCDRCQTPHHTDCARFIGQCAVFGCGGRAFATGTLSGALVQVTDAAVIEVPPDAPPEPAPDPDRMLPVPAQRLNRGAFRRTIAAVQLLLSNPRIAGPLLIPNVIIAVLNPNAVVNALVAAFVQGALVIGMLAQAGGKERGWSEINALMAPRWHRIWRAALSSGVRIYVPITAGVILICVSMWAPAANVLALIAGALFLLRGMRNQIVYSLATVVGCMGEDDPDAALPRSVALMRPHWGAAVASYALGSVAIVAMVVAIALGASLGEPVATLIGALLLSVFNVVVATYWFLFYLEARRSVQRTFLPHAPQHFLPHQ